MLRVVKMTVKTSQKCPFVHISVNSQNRQLTSFDHCSYLPLMFRGLNHIFSWVKSNFVHACLNYFVPLYSFLYWYRQAASTGFPDLQELSLAVNTDIHVSNGGIAIDDNMLLRILVKSHKLRLLDLRGCTHITAVGIQVYILYFSRTNLCDSKWGWKENRLAPFMYWERVL